MEGIRDDFKEIIESFPDLNMHLLLDSDALFSLLHIKDADIVIGSRSGFTHRGVALSEKGIVIMAAGSPWSLFSYRYCKQDIHRSFGQL